MVLQRPDIAVGALPRKRFAGIGRRSRFALRCITQLIGRFADFDTKASGREIRNEAVQAEYDCRENGQIHDKLLQYDGLHHGSGLVCTGQSLRKGIDLDDCCYADAAPVRLLLCWERADVLTRFSYPARS